MLSLRWALIASAVAILGLRPAAPSAAAAARRVELAGVASYLQATGGESVSLRAYLRLVREADSDPRLPPLLASWMALGGSQSFAGREFATASRAIGVDLKGHAVDDLVVLEASVPPGRLRASLRLLADVIMYPAFDGSVADAAWGESRSDAAIDDASELARRALAIAPDATVARRFARPTRDEVKALHERSAGRDAVVLAVTGPIDGLDLEKDVRDAFSGFRKAEARASESLPAPVKRTATIAVREVTAGQSRLMVVARGAPRASSDWLAVEVGLIASIFSVESDAARLPPMIAIEQPVVGVDWVIVDRVVPSDDLGELQVAYDHGFTRARTTGLRSRAMERARTWLGSALVPPPDRPYAARAHALLEALGAGGLDPAIRFRQLRGLSLATIAEATAKHLTP